MKKINIILDIDNTLVRNVNKVKDPRMTINLDGVHYHMFPGCLEFLRFVAKLMGNTLVFFSNGTKSRNDALVDLLMKRAFNGVYIKYQVYSRADHHDEAVTKNLTLIVPPAELGHTVLIDDDELIIAKTQRKNIIVINNNRKNNLFYVAGLLKISYEMYNANNQFDFVTITHFVDETISVDEIQQEGRRACSRLN